MLSHTTQHDTQTFNATYIACHSHEPGCVPSHTTQHDTQIQIVPSHTTQHDTQIQIVPSHTIQHDTQIQTLTATDIICYSHEPGGVPSHTTQT